MPISTRLLTGSLAGAALLLSAGAALADPAEATGAVNVRSGPGVNYSIVDQLAPGENVDIGECDGGWCHIDHAGPDGWVSANYLSPLGDYSPPPSPPVYYYEQEPEYVPAPVFVTPPTYYDRRDFRRHYPHRRYPGTPPTTSPPPVTTPPPVQNRQFPPGYGRQFRDNQVAPGSSPPAAKHFPPGYGRQFYNPPQPAPGSHPPRGTRPSGNDFCATNPTAPICSGGGGGPHHH